MRDLLDMFLDIGQLIGCTLLALIIAAVFWCALVGVFEALCDAGMRAYVTRQAERDAKDKAAKK